MALTDMFGNPLRLDRSLLPREIASPGVSGVRRHEPSGISTGLTPARLATLLKDSEGQDPRAYFRLAEEMEEKETEYLAALGSRKRAVCQLEMTVEPAGDSAEDERDAELVRDWLSRDSLEDELFDILDAVGKGISLTEIVWETSARQWMPARLEWVHPTFITLDPVDLRTPMLKADSGSTPLPAYKFIWTQIRAKSGLPVRGGLSRSAAWAYLFKNFGVKGWVQFMEVYGQPYRLGKYGQGATEEEKRTLLRAVRDIGADAAAVIPSGMEIEFILDRGSKGGSGHKELADYMDRRIAKLVLGHSGGSESTPGRLGGEDMAAEVRGDIERADAKAVAAALNQQLVRPLVDLNHGPRAAYPRLRIGRPESVDIDTLSQGVERLVPFVEFSKSEIRARMGLKAPDSAEDSFGGGTGGDGGAPAAPARAVAASDGGCPACGEDRALAAEDPAREPDTVDLLVDAALDDGGWVAQMAPALTPLADAALAAGDLEAVRDGLIARLAEMDTETLADTLARSSFAARIAGRLGADREDADEVEDPSAPALNQRKKKEMT